MLRLLKSKMPFKLLVFIIVFVTFLADRITKYFIINFPFYDGFVDINTGFMSIVRVYNTGAAFGILKDHTFFLMLFSLLVVITLLVYLLKNGQKLNRLQVIGISVIIGGTAGNFFDRLVYGYVIDFIKLNSIDFPIFNIADIFINIGVLIIFAAIFIAKQEDST